MVNLRLRELRERMGWSLQMTADKLNIAKSTYAGYESQRRDIPNGMLDRMAELFNVNTDYILGRSGKPQLSQHQERALSRQILLETVEALGRGEFIDVPKEEQTQMAEFLKWRLKMTEEKMKTQK